MKKMSLIAIAWVLSVMLAGCNEGTAVTGTSGNGVQVEESSVSTPSGSAASDAADSLEGVGSEEQDEGQEQEEQGFTSLELEITEGTLYVRAGDSFSLTRHDGKDVDYEIRDGVLYFTESRTGDIVLTLPEQDSYEAMGLTVKNGHIYVEDTLTLESLAVEMDRGEASLEKLSVNGESSIELEQGSAFLSGDLGQSVKADCREGHLSLEVSFAEKDCSFEISVSEGNIQVGKNHYSGRSYSKTVDNGGERSMELTCSRGDISVEFGK